jgi:hypothetical protein
LVVAIDSKALIRKGKLGSFRANTGVAVKYSNADFQKTYLESMRELGEKYNLKRPTKILKSYDILNTLGAYHGSKFLDEFALRICNGIEKIEVFTSIFDTKTIPKVKIYGTGKTAVKEIKPVEFIKMSEPSFVHLCAWSYISRNQDEKDVPIMLDHFEGELTNAWNVIGGLPNVTVYLSGDKCNPHIATADIIVKLVDIRLHNNKMGVTKENVVKVCSDLGDTDSVLVGPLSMITPISDTKIDLSDKLAHPIIFVLREGLKTEVVGSTKEHNIIEKSPLMHKIYDLAFEQGGCVKFFDANKDQNIIRPSDIFVSIGDSGYNVGKYYQSLGYKIEIIKAETLTEK